jgi:LmbE family N-acetylglucosaminyl deacetylase
MKTLVVAAHMDDEVFSCGALIRRRVVEGGHVGVMVLHRRTYDYGRDSAADESNHQEGLDFFAAKHALGYQEGCAWCNEEGEPGEVGFYTLLETIEHRLKMFQPDEVVVPSPADLNQDHRHLSYVCEIALRACNLGSVQRVLEARSFDGRLTEPQFYLAHDVDVMNAKTQAMDCYRRERRPPPHPRSERNVLAMHRVLGAKVGAEFAEGYGVRLWRDTGGLGCARSSPAEAAS